MIEENKSENTRSGGVKTEEGKQITRLNAIKHGILSKESLLEGENANDLSALQEGIVKQFNPVGEMESFLCERIVSGIWRLKRTLKAEKNNMEYQLNYISDKLELSIDAILNKENSPEEEELKEKQKSRLKVSLMIGNDETEKIIRYENSIERSIYKSLHELQRLQAKRNGENIQAPIAVDFDLSKEQ